MYTRYFGFNEKPFTLTPNPRFIYLSKNHKEAFAHLLYGINNHYGFIELIGEVGTGKTTVLRTLLAQLQEENYRTALIFNPCLSGVELLRSINHEFGIDTHSDYANDLLAELNRFLLAENAEGRTVVLVIDEAQNLQPEVLEQIRLISNLETENDKLIQIILAGQPELKTLLDRPELRQLNQRIAVRYRLRSMSMDETRAYIRHRMEVAGETGGVSFSRYAIKWIYLYTRGVPRMINILCDRALLVAYGDECRRIGAGIVTRAIREILNMPRSRQVSLSLTAAAVCIALAVAAIVGTRFLPFRPLQKPAAKTATTPQTAVAAQSTAAVPPASSAPVAPSSPVAATVTTNAGSLHLQKELAALDQNDVHIQAFNTLMARWEARPIKSFGGKMTVPTMFSRLAVKRGLRLTAFSGTLDDALRFNMPFLIVSRVSGELGPYCIAVTSSANDTLTIAPALAGKNTISRAELSALTGTTFYVAWQNFGQIPDTIAMDERRFEIRSLQRLLKEAGHYRDPVDGAYSTSTADAVREFQSKNKIKPNGQVGEQTLALLTRFETSRKIPSLKNN